MVKFTVGIIGLGNIGMLYDYDIKDNFNFLSHARSFFYHPDFDLRYLIDIDNNKLKLAKKRYGNHVKLLSSIDAIKSFPDIIVLAALPEVNLKIFEKIKDKEEIKLFLIEKPFWDPSMAYDSYAKYSNKCVINYFRKYIPFFVNLKDKIKNNVFGKVLGVHIWYSKGLRNNGSHMIDFVNYFFGPKYDVNTIKIIDSINDYSDKDLSISFSINYYYNNNKFPVILQVANEKCFSLIEFDILFEKARYRIFNSGGKIEIYKVEKNPILKNYKNLVSKEIQISNINKYGYYMCNYLRDLLTNKVNNVSSLKNEYEVYKVIYSVKDKRR